MRFLTSIAIFGTISSLALGVAAVEVQERAVHSTLHPTHEPIQRLPGLELPIQHYPDPSPTNCGGLGQRICPMIAKRSVEEYTLQRLHAKDILKREPVVNTGSKPAPKIDWPKLNNTPYYLCARVAALVGRCCGACPGGIDPSLLKGIEKTSY